MLKRHTKHVALVTSPLTVYSTNEVIDLKVGDHFEMLEFDDGSVALEHEGECYALEGEQASAFVEFSSRSFMSKLVEVLA